MMVASKMPAEMDQIIDLLDACKDVKEIEEVIAFVHDLLARGFLDNIPDEDWPRLATHALGLRDNIQGVPQGALVH
jgi:hypothetical protein